MVRSGIPATLSPRDVEERISTPTKSDVHTIAQSLIRYLPHYRSTIPSPPHPSEPSTHA